MSCWLLLGAAITLILFVAGIGSVAVGLVDTTLLPWRVQRIIRFMGETGASWFDLRGCFCRGDQEVTIRHPIAGLRMAGTVYGLDNDVVRAKILLVHGNTPVGRKLAIYRILASKLAERGFIVLTIDTLGHGESDDPFSPFSETPPSDWKGFLDLSEVIRFAEALEKGSRVPLFLIGHSGGSIPVIITGARHPQVAGIIAIGPPRRTRERLEGGDLEYFWERARRTREKVYAKPFPAWFTKDEYLRRALLYDMDMYLRDLQTCGHAPILFLDGELEGPKDKAYLKKYVDAVAEPKAYLTLKRADHYLNTLTVGELNLYDRQVMQETLDVLVSWMQNVLDGQRVHDDNCENDPYETLTH